MKKLIICNLTSPDYNSRNKKLKLQVRLPLPHLPLAYHHSIALLGKKFYEQLRALQKEIESEKRKLQEETNANSQQTQVESEALEAKLQELNISNEELIEKLSEQSTQCDDLSTQLRTLQVCSSLPSISLPRSL
jgi:DNA repair exonuclease SbcCD ATPase subunit